MLCDDGPGGGDSNGTYTYRSIYKHPNTNIESSTGVGQCNAYNPGLQSTSQGYRAELDAQSIHELEAKSIHELNGRRENSTMLGEITPSNINNNSTLIGEIPLTQSEINAYNHY